MVCLGNRDHSVVFEIASKYCISDSFVEYDGYSISSKGFLPTAAAARLLQSCPTLCDPIDGSPPGSPSPGFSRQEHWSGLPFPSPVRETEK